MAEIVCYIYIFHLTPPMSLHYLVIGGCSKCLLNTGFFYKHIAQIWCQSEESILSNNFLARRPLPDMGRLSRDDFLCFNRMAACIRQVPPDWKRPAGRPSHTWLHAIEADLGPLNFGLATAWRKATTRDEW